MISNQDNHRPITSENAPQDPQIIGDPIELIRFVWREKWIIVTITFIFASASIVYALMATEWYEAEVLLAPVEDQSMSRLASQFGGLASLAGINVGNEGNAEPVAVLRSRKFVRQFIIDLELMPVLFSEEWDAKSMRWRADDPKDQPDIRDGVKLFRDDLLRVSEDAKLGLVTLAVEWKDPEVAAHWATILVERLNERMRLAALEDAQRNIDFLKTQMEDVRVLTIQQSIGSLLETEMQKLMLARGSKEFSFRTIDPATPPKFRSRPKRTLLVITSTIFGGILGLFGTLLFRSLRQRSAVETVA
tara:strand:- start:1184 stop:2095 length:912 start_codon:yes stop_codon:yes gene_type:complete